MRVMILPVRKMKQIHPDSNVVYLTVKIGKNISFNYYFKRAVTLN